MEIQAALSTVGFRFWLQLSFARQALMLVSLDVALRDAPTEIESELKKYKPDYLVVYDDGFNYLTKMCLTVMRGATFTMGQGSQRTTEQA